MSHGLLGVFVRLYGEPIGVTGVTRFRRRRHNASAIVVGVLMVSAKNASSPVGLRAREKVGIASYRGSCTKRHVQGTAEKCRMEDSATEWVAKKVAIVWSSSSLILAVQSLWLKVTKGLVKRERCYRVLTLAFGASWSFDLN